MPPREWLPNPPDGTPVCGGLDGSETDDWTGIRLETVEGFMFTPRWSSTGEAMIWNPAKHGGRIPRSQVHDAWDEITDRWLLHEPARVYCDPGFNDPTDPTSWITEIERWSQKHGEKTFLPWSMGSSRGRQVHSALVRVESDLRSGLLKHDGCPVTTAHMANARKIPKPHDRYILGKPAQHQKIDLAVTSMLCHEAASDARAAGWTGKKPGLTRVTGRVSAH